ncbi:aldo/keto reductase [Amycolatopsis dendrobii]|uniref:Aldo/keto reductase n=1 Tax=Amycolatopsis dendrobii TaxID=2760662 RepID=A0A7W3ZAS9_9PSEU|nr:aldo/keto reductase [Amycolatopsis dendrobii]MBB1154515.1 aldo/keto reductase [Amycolatopsis dendrobii]
MHTFTLAGRTVRRIGYGTMQLAGPKAMGEPADPERAKAAVRAAVDAGVRLIDTSGYYGPEVANRLLAEALRPYPEDLLIATKVGARRSPDGGFVADAAPEAVKAAVRENLAQLGVERLPLVHARFMPDSTVPWADTVGALAELRDEGLLEHVGISNVTLELLDQARAVAPIASVENEYHVGHTGGRDVLDATTAAGLPYLAFRPLGNGALAGENSPLAKQARQLGVSAATLALAWLLDLAPNVAVIPGTSNPAHLADLVAARELALPSDVRAALDEA